MPRMKSRQRWVKCGNASYLKASIIKTIKGINLSWEMYKIQEKDDDDEMA